MKAYQKRVVDEKAALDAALAKLREFIGTEVYAGLDGRERQRLQRQVKIMVEYSNVLAERIEAFEDE